MELHDGRRSFAKEAPPADKLAVDHDYVRDQGVSSGD
jgi:hypothetical protein